MATTTQDIEVPRRTVLKWAGAAGMLAVGTPLLTSCVTGSFAPGSDPNGLILPPGFTSRVIARGNELVAGHQFRWFPDGAATFVDPAVAGGWYLAVNHEVPADGGVTSIRFAPDGTLLSAQPILTGTSVNCAGGATPWGTWLSGEEYDLGLIWECDPTGAAGAAPRPAMGRFKHEAAAVAADGYVYLTEDVPTGAFYRFAPTVAGNLSAGVLEAATGVSPVGTVTWLPVPDPYAGTTPCREQVAGTLEFNGGEGIATTGDRVWFTTKGDNRVWQYVPSTGQMSIRFQGGGSSILSGVDNLWVDVASQQLFVAEDGGDMQLVMIRPDNTAVAIITITGAEGSEVTGPTFSPDGQRLYFNSQRGPNSLKLALGVVYEVTGPFDQLLGRPTPP